jgi:hypothetical protein
MQSAQKHTFINTKNLQGSNFFRTFKYFLAQHSTAQHSLKQLIFSLLLFCSFYSFAQEENTTSFYINPNTTTAGIIYKFPVQGGAVSLNKQLLYLSSLPNNNFAIRCTFVLTRLLRALVCRPPPIL